MIATQLNVAAVNPDQARYHYDASGQRVIKTITRGGRVEQRIYLDGFELYLVRNGSGVLERWEILHLADGDRSVALVETKTSTTNTGQVLDKLIRFQFSNHLGSAVLETDESAAARIISYEEYTPYGETAYIAGQNLSEVRRKRYRYSGKERDNEFGLYCCGARYLVPWTGRWLSCDPIGIEGGLNCFAYASSAPVTYIDPTGLAPISPSIGVDGLEVNDLAEGLSKLDQLANEVNAAKKSTEFFLGEQGGSYRIFNIGELGGKLPKGFTSVGHTHPLGAMITNEDVAEVTANGLIRGSMRSHVIARGNGNFSVLEIAQGQGTATTLKLSENGGTLVDWVGLANDSDIAPYSGTGGRGGCPSPFRNTEDLAEALRSSTAVQDLIPRWGAEFGEPFAVISRSFGSRVGGELGGGLFILASGIAEIGWVALTDDPRHAEQFHREPMFKVYAEAQDIQNRDWQARTEGYASYVDAQASLAISLGCKDCSAIDVRGATPTRKVDYGRVQQFLTRYTRDHPSYPSFNAPRP